jgi:hypothetical protein
MVKLLLREKKTFSHAASTPREAEGPSVNPIIRRANHFAAASRLMVACPAPFAKIFLFFRNKNRAI